MPKDKIGDVKVMNNEYDNEKFFEEYAMGLLNNGFELKVVEEAEPPKEMMDIPGMEDELRRPMMLLVKAIAKK